MTRNINFITIVIIAIIIIIIRKHLGNLQKRNRGNGMWNPRVVQVIYYENDDDHHILDGDNHYDDHAQQQ